MEKNAKTEWLIFEYSQIAHLHLSIFSMTAKKLFHFPFDQKLIAEHIFIWKKKIAVKLTADWILPKKKVAPQISHSWRTKFLSNLDVLSLS